MMYHQLLSYAERPELENMPEAAKPALLRKVVQSGPGEAAWTAILELFANWPDSAARREALEWVDGQLDSWDEGLRVMNSAWGMFFGEEGLDPVVRIGRVFAIHQQDSAGGRQLALVATSPFLSRLRRLTLYRSELDLDSLRIFAGTQGLRGLTHLSLWSVVLQDDKFALLCTAANFPALHSLQLKNLDLVGPNLMALLTAPFLGQLTELDLSYNRLKPEDAALLAGSGRLGRLEQLNISHNPVQFEGVRRLLQVQGLPRLRVLEAAGNRLTAEEAGMLRRLSRGVELIL